MARRGRLLAVALALIARTAHADDDDVLVRGVSGNFASRATIEDSPREITDAASLVEPLPGVHVRRLGADDSFATLSIRGSSSAQVAVYLAGVPLSGGADPTLDLATLPLWPGARATVHRTFAPAALGRGSLGGTLVLDPPSPRSREATEVWLAAGAYGSRRLRVGNIVGVGDGIRITTGLSASRSDDDFSYIDRSATLDQGHDVLRKRLNAGHVAASGLASVAIPVAHGALTITTLGQARRQELPGSVDYETPSQSLASSRVAEAIELTLPAGSGAVGVRAWGRREGLQLHDDPAAAGRGGTASSTNDAILALGGSGGWRGRPLETTTLELRLDGSGERFAPGTWLGASAPPGATRANLGIAADASLLLADRITLSVSGRGDVWVDAAGGSASSDHYQPTGHAGVELPVGAVVVASHAGYVARPPSFVERYGNRGAFLGAPGLRAESAFTTDVGASFTHRFGPLELRAEIAGFATWADDLITFIYVGSRRQARATNIGQARLIGVESELRASAYGLDTRVSYTGLTSANESECLVLVAGECERPPLPGRPAHDVVVDLAYERGPVRLRYGIDYVGGIRADNKGVVEVPARILHGASIRLAVPSDRFRALSLTLDVRNLFDLRAAEYIAIGGGTAHAAIGDLYDYPLPGRRLLFSARIALP